MNIFIREMKANRKSLIIWCLSIIVLIYGAMLKYAGFKESGDLVNKMLDNMPKFIKTIWGLSNFNLMEIKGYYSVMFLYFILMATIHASMLGATILSKEERDKTAEFLLTKPTTRKNIITEKILASLVNLIIFNITTTFFSIIFTKYYSDYYITIEIVKLMSSMFILQLIFLSIGLALGAITKKSKVATSASTAFLLSTFLLSVYIDINGKVDFLKYFTPFKYFEAKNIIFGEGINYIYILLSVLIITASTFVTYKYYNNKDIAI